MNDAVGGKTQLAGLVAAAALLGVALFLGGALAYLPVAVLGAVLVSAALDLIDIGGLVLLWRLSRIELLFAVIAILGVLGLGVLKGVIVAVIATLTHLLWVASLPRDALLGSIAGTASTSCIVIRTPGRSPASPSTCPKARLSSSTPST